MYVSFLSKKHWANPDCRERKTGDWNRTEGTIDEYPAYLHDEKPIILRQSIPVLGEIPWAKLDLDSEIASQLILSDIMEG